MTVHLQKNTIINYKCFLEVFEKDFGHYEVSVISSDDIMNFLVTVTEGHIHISSTKKLKYSLLKTFFNFIKSSIDQNLKNPCNSPLLNKTFKATKNQPWTILDKDVVDEIVSKIILRHSNLATTQNT